MKFYLPDYGETAESAEYLPCIDLSGGMVGVIDFAELAASHFYTHRDGWEAHWPINMVVIDDAEKEYRLSVEREEVPSFRATLTTTEGE
jgi:hypothetical protein